MSFYSGAVSTVKNDHIDGHIDLINKRTFVYPLFVEAKTEEEAIKICIKNACEHFPPNDGYVNYNASVCEVDIFSIMIEHCKQHKA